MLHRGLPFRLVHANTRRSSPTPAPASPLPSLLYQPLPLVKPTNTLPTHLTSILLSDFTSSTPPQTQTNPLTKMSAVTKKTGAAKKAAPAASGPSYRE